MQPMSELAGAGSLFTVSLVLAIPLVITVAGFFVFLGVFKRMKQTSDGPGRK